MLPYIYRYKHWRLTGDKGQRRGCRPLHVMTERERGRSGWGGLWSKSKSIGLSFNDIALEPSRRLDERLHLVWSDTPFDRRVLSKAGAVANIQRCDLPGPIFRIRNIVGL